MAKLTKVEKVALGIMALCIVAIPVWTLLVVPELLKVPKDFSLKIEFNSYGKAYGSKMNIKTESLGRVFLDVKINSVQGDVVVFDSVFDARTLSGKRIYRNERQYKADMETRKSVSHGGKQDVWIVFPEHMEKKPYTSPYFVRVDPVKLEFVGEDSLLRLPVYHYRGSDTVDATKLFSFEKGVPGERGVTNSVQADLWIEPISGHIVKMIDAGENSYHDPNSGKILFIRNIYKNIFSDDTVANHVRMAQNLKMTIQIYEIIVPLLFAVIALAMLISVLLNQISRRV